MEENDGNKKLTSCRAGHSHIHPCFCFLSVRKESWVKRMYSGSMRLTDQAFENSYENSSTPEFKALADLVKKQVRQPHLFFFFFLKRCASSKSCQSCLLLSSPSAQKSLLCKSSTEEVLCGLHRSGFQVRWHENRAVSCFFGVPAQQVTSVFWRSQVLLCRHFRSCSVKCAVKSWSTNPFFRPRTGLLW